MSDASRAGEPSRRWVMLRRALMLLALATAAALYVLSGRLRLDLRPGKVTVFAAASLARPMREIPSRMNGIGSTTSDQITLNLASSSALERQIEAGAPFDVFVSAAPENVDRLIAEGLLDGATRREVARNTLVVIVPSGGTAPADLAALARLPRIAVGQQGVPAGDYARQALGRAGVAVTAELAGYPDEPAVLVAVAEGGAPAGIVYASSLVSHPRRDRVSRAFEVDPALHEPIVYVAAARPGASASALRFLDALMTPHAGGLAFLAAGLRQPAPASSRP